MVQLYALSVLHKGATGANVLKSAFDLTTFGFFQRASVQEFMEFSSRIIVERTHQATRQSVKQEEYMCHVYVRPDNLAGVIISNQEYPHRVAHTLLMKVLDDFAMKVPSHMWASGTQETINFTELPAFLAKYQDPREADALTKITEELEETKIILHNTIAAVLDRGEKLDDLVSKSDALSAQSKMFYKTAKKSSCCSFG